MYSVCKNAFLRAYNSFCGKDGKKQNASSRHLQPTKKIFYPAMHRLLRKLIVSRVHRLMDRQMKKSGRSLGRPLVERHTRKGSRLREKCWRFCHISALPTVCYTSHGHKASKGQQKNLDVTRCKRLICRKFALCFFLTLTSDVGPFGQVRYSFSRHDTKPADTLTKIQQSDQKHKMKIVLAIPWYGKS